MIRVAPLVLALALAGCILPDRPPFVHPAEWEELKACRELAQAVDREWRDRTPANSIEMDAEIAAFFPDIGPDAHCGELTSWRIRKALRDLNELKSPPPSGG